jgi:hypothetical protein
MAAVVNLGARSSAAPLPTGQVQRVVGSGSGVVNWPVIDNFFYATPALSVAMQVGPFVSTTGTFFLHARCWCIARTIIEGWEANVLRLQLVQEGGSGIVDQTNRSQAIAYTSSEAHGSSWHQVNLETDFQVSAGINYYVQMLSSGGGGQYYASSDHIGMVGWTVGEGVYA